MRKWKVNDNLGYKKWRSPSVGNREIPGVSFSAWKAMITKEWLYMQRSRLPEIKIGALKLTELTDTILWKKKSYFSFQVLSHSVKARRSKLTLLKIPFQKMLTLHLYPIKPQINDVKFTFMLDINHMFIEWGSSYKPYHWYCKSDGQICAISLLVF